MATPLTHTQRAELDQLRAEAVALLGSTRYLAHSIPPTLLSAGRQAATNRVVLALIDLVEELADPDPIPPTFSGE